MKNIDITNIDEENDFSNFDSFINIKKITFFDQANKKEFSFSKNIKNLFLNHTKLLNHMDPNTFMKKSKHSIAMLEKTNLFNSILLKQKKEELTFYLVPKSFHFQSFSQNFGSSGKIGFCYEIGLRNLLKQMEITSFKYEKNLGGSNLLDFSLNFPFFEIKKKLVGLKVFSNIGNENLFEDLFVNKKDLGIRFSDEENSHFFEMDFKIKRLIFPSLNYACYDYDNFLKTNSFFDLVYSKKNTIVDENNFFHFWNSSKKVTISKCLSLDKTDLILDYDLTNKTYLRHFIPSENFQNIFKFYKIELESNFSLNFIFNLNRNRNFSIFNKKYFSKLRGFENIDSNIPFLKKSQKNKITNNISFSFLHTFKINLLHFPHIENQKIYPFFYFSNLWIYDKIKNFDRYSTGGIGMEFKINEFVGIEVLYNFFYSYQKKFSKTKEENLQIRISLNN